MYRQLWSCIYEVRKEKQSATETRNARKEVFVKFRLIHWIIS
jgi:hypothetical protein